MAPGKDGKVDFVVDLLKRGQRILKRKLMEMIKVIWKTKSIPDEQNAVIICPILIKGYPAEIKKLQMYFLIRYMLYDFNNSNIRMNNFTTYAKYIIGLY